MVFEFGLKDEIIRLQEKVSKKSKILSRLPKKTGKSIRKSFDALSKFAQKKRITQKKILLRQKSTDRALSEFKRQFNL